MGNSNGNIEGLTNASLLTDTPKANGTFPTLQDWHTSWERMLPRSERSKPPELQIYQKRKRETVVWFIQFDPGDTDFGNLLVWKDKETFALVILSVSQTGTSQVTVDFAGSWLVDATDLKNMNDPTATLTVQMSIFFEWKDELAPQGY